MVFFRGLVTSVGWVGDAGRVRSSRRSDGRARRSFHRVASSRTSLLSLLLGVRGGGGVFAGLSVIGGGVEAMFSPVWWARAGLSSGRSGESTVEDVGGSSRVLGGVMPSGKAVCVTGVSEACAEVGVIGVLMTAECFD